jgi:hypothetical protein
VDDGTSLYDLGDDIKFPLGQPIIGAWLAYRDHHILPHTGGWFDQPLTYLVHFFALDLVTRTFAAKGGADWSNFSIDQRTLIKWLQNIKRT